MGFCDRALHSIVHSSGVTVVVGLERSDSLVLVPKVGLDTLSTIAQRNGVSVTRLSYFTPPKGSSRCEE